MGLGVFSFVRNYPELISLSMFNDKKKIIGKAKKRI